LLRTDPHLLIAERLTGWQHVERRRQFVGLGIIDEHDVILLVIVGVVDEDVEHHPAKQLAHLDTVRASPDDAAAAKQLRELGVAELLGGSLERDVGR
jgi:hypothetical protein